MIMIWIKFITHGLFVFQKEHHLMRNLLRIPFIRQGLIIKTLEWMTQGVSQLQEFDFQESKKRNAVVGAFETTDRVFYVERGSGLPGKLDLHNYLLQCLRCFKYLTTSS